MDRIPLTPQQIANQSAHDGGAAVPELARMVKEAVNEQSEETRKDQNKTLR